MKNNETSAKKQKADKPAELSFVKAESFLQAWGSDCKGLPKEALVLNGVLWDGGLGPKEYEAFIPVEGNKVAYGRISFSQLNGKGTCLFRRLGRVMGKNRLNLPAVSFSDRAITGARAPASANDHQDISVEFLRFAPMDPATRSFSSDGRKPSSVKDQERPPLILRVFRVTSHSSEKFSDRGEWRGTEEFIYRLWRVSWQ
jgi:hypothetical protein